MTILKTKFESGSVEFIIFATQRARSLMVSTAEEAALVSHPHKEAFILDRVIKCRRLEPMNMLLASFLKLTVSSSPWSQGSLSRKLTSQDSWRWLCQACWPESGSPWRTVYGVPALLTPGAHAWCSQSSCVTEGLYLPEI